MADNVSLIVNETIDNVVINPSITTEVIDVSVSGTDTNVDISVTPNLTIVNINQVTGGGNDIEVRDENILLTSSLEKLNFIGNGVTASFVNGGVLVNVPGGGESAVQNVTATSPITSTGGANPIISTSIGGGLLVGRRTGAVAGAMETITVGSNLTLTTAGVLNANVPAQQALTAVAPLFISEAAPNIVTTLMNPNALIGRWNSGGGSGVMQEITVGAGLALSAGGTLTNTSITPVAQGYYGAFQDMLTQTITTANVGQPFLIRTTVENNQVTITQNESGQYTRITPQYTGVYNIQWSGQFQNPTNEIHDIDVWFKKGLTSTPYSSTDVVGSNGKVALPARKSATVGHEGHVIASWNFVLTINAGEFVEFYWMSNSTAVTLQAYSAVSPPPSTASLIVTVTQQAGVIAGVTPSLSTVLLNGGRTVNEQFFDYGEDPPLPAVGTVMTVNNVTFDPDLDSYLGTAISASGKIGINAIGLGDGAKAINAYSLSGNAIVSLATEFYALDATSTLGIAINATSNGDNAINAYSSANYGIYARAINNYAAFFEGGSVGGINVISDGGTLVNIVHNANNLIGIKSRGNVEAAANHIECYTELGVTPSFKVGYSGQVETTQLTTDRMYVTQPTIVTITTTPVTLTYTNISVGLIRTSASGAVALTLPTGASMQTMGIPLGKAFNWNIINSSAGATTLAAGVAHGIVGSSTINTGSSAAFRTLQTAINTYTTYRIS